MRLIIPFMFTVFIFLISCKKEEKIEFKNKTIYYDETNVYEFEFPDTVYLKKKYDGYLRYRSELDTIVDHFDNLKLPRHAFFLMRKTDDETYYSINELINLKLDTLIALNNGEIPLLNIQFNYEGTFYLDGVITDLVFLESEKKGEKGQELVEIVSNKIRARHRVVVIDSPDRSDLSPQR